ncbi:hypothetical protein V6M85_09075 [Sulfolobus tengchongensis]|uniref:Carboxypeptidase regulatory-like domain-containing protein n=1 Tax=Sulfolobus tengchongensis TaxID=207809 RepID=A0AAX4KXT1_9CREN
MKFSYTFTQEFKRTLIYLYVILIALASAYVIGQFSTRSANVIGIVEYSTNGIKVTGYVFDFQGKGISSTVKAIYEDSRVTTKTNNGSFSLCLPITYESINKINIVIDSSEGNLNFSIISRPFTTFAYGTLYLKLLSSQNLSIISVKGKTFVALNPYSLRNYINGMQIDSNTSIFVVNSDNVTSPNPLTLEYYNNNSNLIDSLKMYLILLLSSNFALIDFVSYFLLSSFPRGELKEIIRLVGLAKVYLAKLIAEIPLIIGLSTLPFYLFLVTVMGNVNYYTINLIIPYSIGSFTFSLGIYGLSPLGSKNMIYYSIILALYITNLIVYDRYIYCLISTFLLLLGYFWLRNH